MNLPSEHQVRQSSTSNEDFKIKSVRFADTSQSQGDTGDAAKSVLLSPCETHHQARKHQRRRRRWNSSEMDRYDGPSVDLTSPPSPPERKASLPQIGVSGGSATNDASITLRLDSKIDLPPLSQRANSQWIQSANRTDSSGAPFIHDSLISCRISSRDRPNESLDEDSGIDCTIHLESTLIQ